MSVVLLVVALLITVGAGFLLVKHYQPVLVLLLAGFALLAATALLHPSKAILDAKSSTGLRWFDIFVLFEKIAGDQLTSVGLIIMAAGGFSRYMNKIGATRALVELVSGPVARLNRPYLVMLLAYVIGQLLFMVIPSAAGLATLLLVLMLPIMVTAGVTPAAAAAVIATTTALPMGPGTGTEVLAAKNAGLAPVVFFVKAQLPTGLITMAAIMLTHYFVQRHYDRRNLETYGPAVTTADPEERRAPRWYALFLLIPVALLVVFSPLTRSKISLSTVAAFLIAWLVALLVELLRTRQARTVLADANSFFTGMGAMFSSVVTLIIAAQLFAEGLTRAGVIDTLLHAASGRGFPIAIIAIIFTLIVGAVTWLTGSGVGAFSAFASLAPNVAKGLGGSPLTLLNPMQFAGGLFRAFSPISGVVIAVAGGVGVEPLAIVRRTWLPMVVGIVTMMVASLLLV